MSDEWLSRAARALRESRDGRSDRAARTRERVVAAALAQRRRRRSAIMVAVPLAAVVGLSTAWAAATGRLSRGVQTWWTGRALPASIATAPQRPRSAPELPAPPPADGADDSARAKVDDALPAPEPVRPAHVAASSGAQRAITATGPAERPASATGPAQRPASATGPAQRPASAAAGGGADREDDLYALAHRAHFVTRDPAAALPAWDAYLAAYPRGRFALEARYNRALSLVRLGRLEAARGALSAFASGAFGGYRAGEARELLDALGDAASPPR